ncbi:hypothetical protein CALCODRAFT_9894 [Calocera cornea HHB12733]|uniref:MFS general substrate transporter n=1 Tax=Calocera cornea HHB12733 TaxID=1353952 RepID=A0A165J6B3_9BASI|nr:hypothetical protein CALCODRAFT_9894 [Calocera cornea HHB12733]
MEKSDKCILRSVIAACYTPFELLIHDPMALLLNLWTSILRGILYLFFNAFPIVFREHGLTLQQTGLTFLILGTGNLIGTSTQFFISGPPDQPQLEKYHGVPPLETRLFIGMAGGLLVPLSLFWFAFSTYPGVHWIVPVLAGIPFGCGGIWIFTSVFTCLVSTYRPVAASALASNGFLRSVFAAAFPLFSTYM